MAGMNFHTRSNTDSCQLRVTMPPANANGRQPVPELIVAVHKKDRGKSADSYNIRCHSIKYSLIL